MDTVTQRKKGWHTGVLVWRVVCDGVSESLHRNKSGGMVDWKGEWMEWKTWSHKSKKMLFSLKPFFPSFSFFSLFQTLSFPDSLLLCHNPLTITHSTLFSSTTHVHVHNEHKPKTNTTYNSFHCVCLMFKLSFVTSFFNRTSSFVHHSAHTMRHASNNIHV